MYASHTKSFTSTTSISTTAGKCNQITTLSLRRDLLYNWTKKGVPALLSSIYANETPALLHQLAQTPEMRRLSDIGMHCGCEYASFPTYKRAKLHYTRLMHSIGVASIVWHFSRDIRQAAAGMLHDIATPVFAHTIDFMNKDYLAQESTENLTLSMIEASEGITALLDEHGIPVEDVGDYHRYPIADNDTPMLSADRLEYTLGNGCILHDEGLEPTRAIYEDLCVAENEAGAMELSFRSLGCAKRFVGIALRNSYTYVSDEDRFAMQRLSDILRHALDIGAIAAHDLYATEREVIEKLRADADLSAAWDAYTQISGVESSQDKPGDRYSVNISAKRRYIDPLVLVGGAGKRLSELDAGVKRDIDAFLGIGFDKWLYTL
jgi:hypothetical protein